MGILTFPMRKLSVLFLIGAALFGAGIVSAQSSASARLDVRIVSDEAEAVLSILQKKNSGSEISDSDWNRLFSSEGYMRLKKREAAMQRSFTDDEFRAFVLSTDLTKRAALLADTLAQWKAADVSGAAGRALAYLPASARIRAKIYPVIKPRENSFVFETKTDPAIFLYLDPEKTAAQYENTLAHELHHIGYSGACPDRDAAWEKSSATQATRIAMDWLGAFGEGAAMLAAAGGPDIHPHASSNAEDRARWDRDVANFNSDLPNVEKFFLDILSGRLDTEEKINARGFDFFGVQGPWYTVGWKMAVTIERAYGREKLIECFCDRVLLLATFNRAAAEMNRKAPGALALWSAQLIEPLQKASDAVRAAGK
jgi:hypothetical protein